MIYSVSKIKRRLARVRKWQRLVRDPVHIIGLMFMKMCEFAAGGRGFVIQFLSMVNWNPDAIAVDLGCGDGEFSVKIKKQIGCKEMYYM